MSCTAESIRNQWKNNKRRNEEKFNKALLKSKRRNKLLCQIEYVYLSIKIRFFAKLRMNGCTYYSRYYRISEKTISKLKRNGFTVYNRESNLDYKNIFELKIFW